MIMRLIYFLLSVAFIANAGPNKPNCNDKEAIQLINIAFDYKGSKSSERLYGTDQDLKIMQELFPNLRKGSLNFTDKNSPNKEVILNQISESVKNKKEVVFNYAGHGILLPSGGFGIVLPGMPEYCNNGLFEPLKLEVGSYRSSRSPNSKQESIIPSKINPKQDMECRKYVITNTDLAKLFRGKVVHGLIDSCFSGALINTEGLNFIYSATANTPASDTDPSGGGRLFGFIKQIKDKYPCSLTGQTDSKSLFYSDIAKVFVPLSLDGTDWKNLPENVTLRGLGRIYIPCEDVNIEAQKTYKDKSNICGQGDAIWNFGDLPPNCDSIKVAIINSDVCENPDNRTFKVGKTQIECPNGKIIPPNTPATVTNIFVKEKKYGVVIKGCDIAKVDQRLLYEIHEPSKGKESQNSQ